VSDARRVLLKLAIAACERGDALGALPLLVAFRDTPDEQREPSGSDVFAESYVAFGRRLGVSARTIRTWVRDGRIPSSAVIGEGRGRRIVVALALVALRPSVTKTSEELAGADYVARRRLRLVKSAGEKQ
jgi:excisionase family DNA binding protein